MTRIARLIWVNEFIWTQFQALYPRQASKFLESSMGEAINLKLDFADAEIQELRTQAQQNKKIMEQHAESNIMINSKIHAWEAKKREEILIKKEKDKERLEKAHAMDDAIDASDFIRDLDVL